MKIVLASIFTLLLSSMPVLAQDSGSAVPAEQKPTEESIRHLLDVMQAKLLMQTAVKQVDATYKATVTKMLDGKTLTPEQEKTLEAGEARMRDLMHDILSWESMEPMYLRVYANTFSQSEIDSMVDFYSSAAGHAVIVKLPLAMQNTMAEMQEHIRALVPKMQQVAKETADQIKSQGAVTKDKSG